MIGWLLGREGSWRERQTAQDEPPAGQDEPQAAHGEPPLPNAPRLRLAVKLYQDGNSIPEVAAFMGIQRRSVRAYLRWAGVLRAEDRRDYRPGLTLWVERLTAPYASDPQVRAWFMQRAAAWLKGCFPEEKEG